MTKQNAPKSTPRELEILAKLAKNGPQTRLDLGIGAGGDYYMLKSMIEQGLVKIEKIETGRRGRPPHAVKLAKKGRDRARSQAVKTLVASL